MMIMQTNYICMYNSVKNVIFFFFFERERGRRERLSFFLDRCFARRSGNASVDRKILEETWSKIAARNEVIVGVVVAEIAERKGRER